MATNSSILAWRIPWTEEPGGLQSVAMKIGNPFQTKQGLEGIFPTQGLNLGLLQCRQILYHLSHQIGK